MMDITKLRKVSDDLYVEEYAGKDGAKRQFKYEREFETLELDLFDAQVVFSSEVNLKETQWDGTMLTSPTLWGLCSYFLPAMA